MLISTIRDLLVGQPIYEARSPWRPLLAMAAAIGILLLAGGAATAALNALGLVPSGIRMTRPAPLPDETIAVWGMAVWLFAMQATTIALVYVASGMFGGRPAEVLSLFRTTPPRVYVAAIILMFLAQAAYNAIVLPFAGDTVMDDAKPFLGPLSSDAMWLFGLAIVIGAPLSEELLFRGFLLSALAPRLGFGGAAFITTAGWTVLHAGYSGLGLLEVFIAGLFFSWLLWRTGNLMVPIVAHAFYNGVVLLALLAFAQS